MKIVVTGSIAFDYLMSFSGKFSDHILPDKLDRISVSFLVDSMKQQRGGCAANICYSLALLGENPILVGTVGKDFGDYRKALENVGVDTSGVKVIDDVYTASFFANTDQDGNQICSFYSGAMQYASTISLKNLIQEEDVLVIISPNDPKAMEKYIDECREMNAPFIYDPSQQITSMSDDMLRKGVEGAKMLVLNDYELEMFKKKTDYNESAILNIVEYMVVTLGEKGSIIRSRKEDISIPIASVKTVHDPTGVGDAFRAGLLKGIKHAFPWEIAGRMGSLASAYVLETEGPQHHEYTPDSFINRYFTSFGECDDLRRLMD